MTVNISIVAFSLKICKRLLTLPFGLWDRLKVCSGWQLVDFLNIIPCSRVSLTFLFLSRYMFLHART